MRLTLPYVFIVIVMRIVEVTAQGKIMVTGATTGINIQTGVAPARININDLYQERGPSWDLYIQALVELQTVDESDELSYFQIMGIHGLPYYSYNEVGQVPGGADLAGYCPHSELLFGLWHRPYVALYEQTLVSHALNISLRYTGDNASIYRTAAESLRVAYWDWGTSPRLPEAVTLEVVTVNGPTGLITIRNPLHHYEFQNFPFTIEYMDAGVLSTQNHTSRCPTANMVDNVTLVNERLSESGDLRQQVYQVFTTVQAFQYMETDRYNKPSFESPHNIVHNSVGCINGTMMDLNWAGFDPSFMLHHANVDRLIALWQAIYPNSSIFDIVDYEGALYGTAAGNVSADTPLKPFYQQGGNFHTSNTVRSIDSFGYTYPELQPALAGGGQNVSLSTDELAAYVKYRVNSLYGGGISSSSQARAETKKHRRSGAGSPTGSPPTPQYNDASTTSKTWSVTVSIEKSEVPLPATIGFYLEGDSLVGKVALLAIPAAGVTHSTITLDRSLSVANVDLADDDSVTHYLKRYLRFDVQSGDGMAFEDITTIESLTVVVLSRRVTPQKNDYEFPTYEAAVSYPWPLATSGR